MQFGIGHPPPTYQLQSTCVGGAQGSKIFKWNSIISIRSKVMAFLVILLSPCGPRHPRFVPVIPTSSPHRPRHPQKVPMWSPWSVVPTCCPRHPHIVPVVPVLSPSSPHRLEGPHIMPYPPDTHFTQPPPPGGAQISKNAIRFELIKIF